MEYTFAAELQRPRANSACTTAVNEYGDTVVAIAGGGCQLIFLHSVLQIYQKVFLYLTGGFGGSQGLEIWNPKDGTVTLEVDRLPQVNLAFKRSNSYLSNLFAILRRRLMTPAYKMHFWCL